MRLSHKDQNQRFNKFYFVFATRNMSHPEFVNPRHDYT